MATAREKFSSQADPKLLVKLRQLAEKEGKQFQSVLEEALTEYLERHQTHRPRTHVLEAFWHEHAGIRRSLQKSRKVSKHEYLTVADALALHAILIKRYGGSDGVRDMGALESALFRPQTGYYKDLIEEAAALLESLAINHPFIDGNKRVAFAVTDTFLRINGFQFIIDSNAIYKKFMELFDSGNFKFEALEKWMRKVISAA